MLQAEITLQYPSPLMATAVVKALKPDNKLPNGRMRIDSKRRKRTVVITVRNCRRIETLQATIQDLFRCLRATEAAFTATV